MNYYPCYRLILLFVCSPLLLNTGMATSAYAKQNSAVQEVPLQSSAKLIYGKVTEVIDASGYTYAEVDTGTRRVWAAGPVTALKTGDMIAFSTEMAMKNFHSKSMGRDFPVLYFVSRFIADKDVPAAGITASPHNRLGQQPAGMVTGIDKLKGGYSIAEIHARKEKLNGKQVGVRGQVTRFTAAVMGTNWIHVSDSSTRDDLTVTSADTVAIGDVVVIKGRLELDKDFGYGYRYPVIVQDAKITKE